MRTKNIKTKNHIPSFPFWIPVIALVCTLFMGTLVLAFSFKMINFSKYNLIVNESLELNGVILQLNEAMNMQAQMAAITGDLSCEKLYTQYVQELEKTTDQMTILIPIPEFINRANVIKLEEQHLDTLNTQIFQLTKQVKLEEARQILHSTQYKTLKADYLTNIKSYYELVKGHAINEARNNLLFIRYLFITLIASIFFSFLTWILTYNKIHDWKTALESLIKSQLDYDQKLKDSYNTLEKRVEERTLELSESNRKLSISLDDLHISQNKYIQSEKMVMLGQFSSGIAHEINNPLSFVMSNFAVLRKRMAIISHLLSLYQELLRETNQMNSPPLKEMSQKISTYLVEHKIQAILEDFNNIIDESTSGSTRIEKIVANLGGFSRIYKEPIGNTDVNFCIESAIESIFPKSSSKIKIHKNLAKIPIIIASEKQLIFVLENLLLNASESITGPGEITVTSESNKSTVVIKITDNGCGITDTNKSKLFTPFFSTKPFGERIGFGLSTAFSIIKMLGGNISVESTVGSGSTFTITIPIKK